MRTESFGTTKTGEKVTLFTLTNPSGMIVKITNYGGIITELHLPGKDGKTVDVVLGFKTLQPYLDGHPYFGCIVGRVAGRTTKGTFTLHGKTYQLAINNDSNHLHGGLEGFDKKVWQAKTVAAPGGESLLLTYTSVDGEEGYPGTLETRVTYSLTDDNQLVMEYLATSDQDTPVCLTNHTYFNLCGSGTALGHEMQIMADAITENDNAFTLLDQKVSLENHPADFRTPAVLKDKLAGLFLQHGSHYWLNHTSPGSYDQVAMVRDPSSGVGMRVYSDAPCMQFYTGKFLDSTLPSKDGKTYNAFDGLCFECHDYPNGANAPDFASNILPAGKQYHQKTAYAFEF